MHPFAQRHVRYVASFAELIATPFAGEINALCWSRTLAGDFGEIIDKLHGVSPRSEEGITSIDDDDLCALSLSPAGALAREALLADQVQLRDQGLAPSLDCITGYTRDEAAGPIPTDVFSFHVDSAPVPADTYLCTYSGACSEGLPNAHAMRRVDHPATRAALLAHYGGADDANFVAHVREHHYDLHYAPLPEAKPYAFGVGNLWRIAIAHPTSPVLPCIHRAPLTLPGDAPRLLLIS